MERSACLLVALAMVAGTSAQCGQQHPQIWEYDSGSDTWQVDYNNEMWIRVTVNTSSGAPFRNPAAQNITCESYEDAFGTTLDTMAPGLSLEHKKGRTGDVVFEFLSVADDTPYAVTDLQFFVDRVGALNCAGSGDDITCYSVSAELTLTSGTWTELYSTSNAVINSSSAHAALEDGGDQIYQDQAHGGACITNTTNGTGSAAFSLQLDGSQTGFTISVSSAPVVTFNDGANSQQRNDAFVISFGEGTIDETCEPTSAPSAIDICGNCVDVRSGACRAVLMLACTLRNSSYCGACETDDGEYELSCYTAQRAFLSTECGDCTDLSWSGTCPLNCDPTETPSTAPSSSPTGYVSQVPSAQPSPQPTSSFGVSRRLLETTTKEQACCACGGGSYGAFGGDDPDFTTPHGEVFDLRAKDGDVVNLVEIPGFLGLEAGMRGTSGSTFMAYINLWVYGNKFTLRPVGFAHTVERMKKILSGVEALTEAEDMEEFVGLKNANADCWYECGKSGPCIFCGTGKCCRKDWYGGKNGCDVSEGGETHHVCVGEKGQRGGSVEIKERKPQKYNVQVSSSEVEDKATHFAGKVLPSVTLTFDHFFVKIWMLEDHFDFEFATMGERCNDEFSGAVGETFRCHGFKVNQGEYAFLRRSKGSAHRNNNRLPAWRTRKDAVGQAKRDAWQAKVAAKLEELEAEANLEINLH